MKLHCGNCFRGVGPLTQVSLIKHRIRDIGMHSSRAFVLPAEYMSGTTQTYLCCKPTSRWCTCCRAPFATYLHARIAALAEQVHRVCSLVRTWVVYVLHRVQGPIGIEQSAF